MTFQRCNRLTRASLALVVVSSMGSLACTAERQKDNPAVELHEPARPAPVPAAPTSTSPSPSQPTARSDGADAPAALSAGGGAQSPGALHKIRFVAIGDYGWSGPAEERTADLVAAFQPDFVITTGDNNYPSGSAATIDENIGQYFSDFIYPYQGSYGSNATENRFFPSLGNHDWGTPDAQPYVDYFTLPGNERYYDFVRGDVHFFAIDSDYHEPDGITADSQQAKWLQRELAASTAPFNLVYMHHPPYSSGSHGNTQQLQWPYAAWGADLVVAGHDHTYERLQIDGITYVVSGLGGASIYSFGLEIDGSVARYNAEYGVTVFEADARELNLAFFTVDGVQVDQATIKAY